VEKIYSSFPSPVICYNERVVDYFQPLNNHNHMKLKPYLAGLLQSLGVTVYCLLVAVFFRTMEKLSITPIAPVGTALMLLLLVFSAAVTGLLVFGYPCYLAINNKIKDALTLLAFTLLYCLLIFVVILFLLII